MIAMAVGIKIDGAVLRALRTDRLWSQQELATRSRAYAAAEGDRQCAITRETVSKLERGQRAPSPRTIRYLVGALGMDADELRRLLRREPPRALAELASPPRLEAQLIDLLGDLRPPDLRLTPADGGGPVYVAL